MEKITLLQEGLRLRVVFKFELGQQIRLTHSRSIGTIIGRSEFTFREPNYLIRLCRGNSQVEEWQGQSAIEAYGPEISRPAAPAGVSDRGVAY